MQSDTHNPLFELAVQFVNQTSRSVFLTGKAGTGKTTFLKFIRENSFKKIAVTAPTGVAAINAGGTTLHSFFQLPFGPFLPAPQQGWNTDNPGYSDPNSLFRNIRFNAARRELLQELELLIIDEISMVRADTLDAIDTILRHFRQQPLLPFGGLQLLYIGDLFQLPPVVPTAEWELLQQHYSSPFFFDARVIAQSPPVYLELKKIYRQNEARFIHLLNNIRNNRATPEDLDTLSDYYQPDFAPPKNDNYITLTSHNNKADRINQQELSQLRGRTQSYEASVTGEFNDKAYPAEKTLSLKEGAQVMLIKNDKGESRRYYNGKIGTIKKLAADRITLHFPDEPDDLVLEKEIWKNIRYNYDKEKDRVEEEELGSFSQYPIRLAWAITIHKSQGLTFEKAVIDAGESFAPGQVYVALSRLTALNGLVLRSRITPFSIRTDPRVIAFTENRLPDGVVEQQLEQEQLAFISSALLRTFDWTRLSAQLQDHFDGYAHRQFPGKIAAIELAKTWLDNTLAQQDTAQKFTRQLEQLLPEAETDGYQRLQQRTEAAATWFIRLIDDQLLSPLQQHIGEIRIKQKTKKYLQDLHALKMICVRKRQQIEDSLQLIAGLQKGVGATRLLAGLEENRRNRQSLPPPAEEPSPTPGRPQKGNTHRISLRLYKEGIPVAEIATRRGLTATTVESHLASFIPSGEIDVKELVPEHKIAPILAAIRETGSSTLGPLKSRLGNDYSFGEIRAVLSHFKHTSAAS
ncbi:MAG TPA: helix-turn-helix domain-containing protein [Puia sp.]|nr:helix-turn-helix domain-containing protein [Puia sp.]